jgi:hypothetical protein
MGVSNKLMEELILAYADKLPIKSARIADIAFSKGSLLQGFLERMNKKQPWACPLGIRRFFVSQQESGDLCLMASILGEPGDIFFPKLNEEKDIISFELITLDLLYELGYEPDFCENEQEAKQKALELTPDSKRYPIYYYSSLTSGDKSFAEFYTKNEVQDINSFTNLGVIKNTTKRPGTPIFDTTA